MSVSFSETIQPCLVFNLLMLLFFFCATVKVSWTESTKSNARARTATKQPDPENQAISITVLR
jgi:hypothetical protein